MTKQGIINSTEKIITINYSMRHDELLKTPATNKQILDDIAWTRKLTKAKQQLAIENAQLQHNIIPVPQINVKQRVNGKK